MPVTCVKSEYIATPSLVLFFMYDLIEYALCVLIWLKILKYIIYFNSFCLILPLI